MTSMLTSLKGMRDEAVHEIRSWDDLRRRLQGDRRCFAFFHPALPGEPLIFVEVALLPEMPGAIEPLITIGSEPKAREEFLHAVTDSGVPRRVARLPGGTG